MTVERADIHSPRARALIRALDAELLSRYPESGTDDHFELDAEEIAPGLGAFLIASRAGEAVGCGAGRAVLAALEAEARALGLERLVLETGVRQPEAIGLYERAGFSRTERFGDYDEHELSVFMGKDLRVR